MIDCYQRLERDGPTITNFPRPFSRNASPVTGYAPLAEVEGKILSHVTWRAAVCRLRVRLRSRVAQW